ncbi:MAG: hypothetical protein HYV26_20750 [Candidatus Hydrogenedentes bacterium]|nr:hypothetical protein [Candidatus Hydrogenedentota bacterium]
MAAPVKLAVERVDFFMRNVTLRLPFRYGKACLIAAPLLHTRLIARDADGRRAVGACADMLPPKWFDKNPEKGFHDNVADLLTVARIGRQQYLDAGTEAAPVFTHWRAAYPKIEHAAFVRGLNGLTASFGSSIIERALIDAACHLEQSDFFTMVKENRLGIEPAAVHPELEGLRVADAFPPAPLSHVHVRHTVGLGDPLAEQEVTAEARLDDGLPQTLDAWALSAGVRYFKVKVQGTLEKDLARLTQVMEVLRRRGVVDYQMSLDGNEQFPSADVLRHWLEGLAAGPLWAELRERVLFIEQPLERSVALRAPLGELGGPAWPPIIIDESDDHPNALKQAVARGYRGTSVKNCKGVFHALLNKMLIDHYRREGGNGFILSSEDLCNQPLLPLQQDLCTLSVLGVTHSERNGHHYVGTLDHLPQRELEACLRLHGSLYEPFGNSARLKIRGGLLDLSSLRQPGYSTALEPDWESMTPAEEWQFESLGIEEG